MNDVYDTVFKTPDGPLHDCICLSRGDGLCGKTELLTDPLLERSPLSERSAKGLTVGFQLEQLRPSPHDRRTERNVSECRAPHRAGSEKSTYISSPSRLRLSSTFRMLKE